MKQKIIDNQCVLNHARSYQYHQPKYSKLYSELFNINVNNNNNTSINDSMNNSTFNNTKNNTPRNRSYRCSYNQNTITNFCKKNKSIKRPQQINNSIKNNARKQAQKMYILYQQLKFIYLKLSQLYKTNEEKLQQQIYRHIKLQYYIHYKQIYQAIRNFKTTKQNLSIFNNINNKKVYNELNKFKQFLQSLYQKKCLKQIQIIEDNIIKRQLVIRHQTPLERYQKITKSFRPFLISNSIDIVEEIKNISKNNNVTNQQINKVQNSIFKRLRQTEQKIGQIFHKVCALKQKNVFNLDQS